MVKPIGYDNKPDVLYQTAQLKKRLSIKSLSSADRPGDSTKRRENNP